MRAVSTLTARLLNSPDVAALRDALNHCEPTTLHFQAFCPRVDWLTQEVINPDALALEQGSEDRERLAAVLRASQVRNVVFDSCVYKHDQETAVRVAVLVLENCAVLQELIMLGPKWTDTQQAARLVYHARQRGRSDSALQPLKKLGFICRQSTQCPRDQVRLDAQGIQDWDCSALPNSLI